MGALVKPEASIAMIRSPDRLTKSSVCFDTGCSQWGFHREDLSCVQRKVRPDVASRFTCREQRLGCPIWRRASSAVCSWQIDLTSMPPGFFFLSYTSYSSELRTTGPAVPRALRCSIVANECPPNLDLETNGSHSRIDHFLSLRPAGRSHRLECSLWHLMSYVPVLCMPIS